ncbi:acetylxylan esterase [uncultured Proteiniphilum sp.]|uniref:acetylxylan esterase n=1 Tax=uncultured Proteiniphilum sp. TaxID=497637 RepID=UPI00344F01B0
MTPDKSDWTYAKGEQAQFQIMVLKNNVPLEGIDVKYRINPEKMDAWEEKTVTLKKGVATVKTQRFTEPGFLQCHASVEVDGKTYSSYATAGFSPEQIEPTTTLPPDFEQFWEEAKSDLAKIPVKPVLTRLPERCTDKVDVYHVSIDNIKGKIYGILCKPKAEGKYPAILHVPGAGIRPYYGDIWSAEKGIITFQIGIHGIPVNLDQIVYDNLGTGALNGYQIANLDDKDNYYYKRVYLGCVRAVDFIESIDCFNGRDIAVTGGSQGGALSIITAALDSRIDYLAAFYPALCDLTGYLNGRAGGWPHMFLDDFTNKPEKVENSKYYDVVNFARFVKVPGWYSWGYNDNVCPPTSMHAAYNVIPAPKELHLFPETQHWTFPEQQEQKNNWLFKKLLE